MTISSTTRVAGPYIGNGTASVFAFTFKVFSASDLSVIRTVTATGVDSTLSLNSDYTVTLNGNQNTNPGGSVTLSAGALATGLTLTITSDIANLQPTDLTNQGGFYPEVITDSLDRATIQIQQMDDGTTRSLKAPVTDPLPLNMTLPNIAQRSGKFLTFDGAGQPIVASGTGSDTALRTDLVNQTAVSAGASIVGFRQPGANATGRTVLSKTREFVSVMDFGAVGNGTTDDTTAFNNAWADQNPRPVFVPAGSYAITGTVTGQFYSFGTVTIVGGTVSRINRFSSNLTVDGATLVVDPTNDRVGIGTASPNTTLHVEGDITITGSMIGNETITGDLAVTGGDITTSTTGTATVFNTSATTLNVGGAATTVTLGSSSGTTTATIGSVSGTVSVGNLSMNAGYGSSAPVYGCRAWVNFDGSTNANQAATYSQSGTTVTVTLTAHGYRVGHVIYADITSGTAVDGQYTITSAATDTFTYTAGTSLTTSGNVTLLRNTIRGSGNIHSVTDYGTGRYYVNLFTPLPDTNYAVVTDGAEAPTAGYHTFGPTVANRGTVAFSVYTSSDTAAADNPSVSIAVFR